MQNYSDPEKDGTLEGYAFYFLSKNFQNRSTAFGVISSKLTYHAQSISNFDCI